MRPAKGYLPMSHAEIGKELGLTAEEVRTIQRRAFEKIKRSKLKHFAEHRTADLDHPLNF